MSEPDDLKRWNEVAAAFTFKEPDRDKAYAMLSAFLDAAKALRQQLFLFVPILAGMRAINAKNQQRNDRLDAVEARVAALEQRPQPKGFSYRGVWAAGEQYGIGDFVTFDGSLWACKAANTNVRPGYNDTSATGWQLSVKRGKDAAR